MNTRLTNYLETRYQQEGKGYDDFTRGGPQEAHARTWMNDDTIGKWRFQRMYRTIDPLLDRYPDAFWLTEGDGRYGCDAHYIQQKGVKVLATDIGDVLLKEAKELGYIHDYGRENAEHLSFPNMHFDFVFCKESYHHFPRPAAALYEMIRVARKGVVLIEPNDTPYLRLSWGRLLRILVRKLQVTLNLADASHSKNLVDLGSNSFEPVGNYVYCVSERELEKAAYGLGLPSVAFAGINDHYEEGVEYETATDGSALFKKVKDSIAKADSQCNKGLSRSGMLVAILFLEAIDPELRVSLTSLGYRVKDMESNPYIAP